MLLVLNYQIFCTKARISQFVEENFFYQYGFCRYFEM